MAETAVQLIVTIGICSLVCLVRVFIMCGEARHLKKARITGRFRPAPRMASAVGERSALEAGTVLSPDGARQGQAMRRFKRVNKAFRDQENLRQIGFPRAQIDRLITYRAAYRAGHYHQDPLMPGRLGVARWLYQQGKING